MIAMWPVTGTHGHGDLESGATGGLCRCAAVEDSAAQRRDQLIVGQMTAVLGVERLPRLAQHRERLGRQLEPHDVGPRLGVTRIVGVIAGSMIGHELLDLPQRLADG